MWQSSCDMSASSPDSSVPPSSEDQHCDLEASLKLSAVLGSVPALECKTILRSAPAMGDIPVILMNKGASTSA